MARAIAHVDLDYFFAQCEELRKPELKSKPVVICVFSGRTSESGAVSTANYPAREFGVKSGMPIFQAKRILAGKDAAFLSVDKSHYETVSERIMAILRSNADNFEQVGIDEAFLDVSARTGGDFEEARALAIRLKQETRDREGITCSIGIGPNKLLAKMASDHEKPDGLTVVSPESVLDFLAPLHVGKIVGVGKKTEKILSEIGLTTIAQLRNVSRERLVELFGVSMGELLHDASRGVDDEPVVERQEHAQISRIVTLKKNSRDHAEIFPEISKLLEDVVGRAADEGLTFKTVSVIGILEDLSIHSRSQTVEASFSSVEKTREICGTLLENLIKDTSKGIRRVGVRISNFAQAKQSQSSLSEFLGSK